MTLILGGLWIVTTLAVLGWLFVLLHPARPWDLEPVAEDQPLPPLPENGAWPEVALLVPARNEAESLPQTLPALLQQDYPGRYCVLLVDDRSSDGTAATARSLAAQVQGSGRLEVLQGAPLPEGWVGKVWALEQGLRQALKSEAKFFLLTDADIKHAPGSLRRLVLESQAGALGLNSRMACLRCQSPAERLLVPAFVYFFNVLYPMRQVNSPASKLAAAAGGCVLLSRAALESLGGGLESIRGELIDDVNLARQIKGRGFAIRLSLSRADVQSLRAYPYLADVWKMVRRSAFTELRYSWLRLAGALLGLGLMFAVPLLAIFSGLALLLAGGPQVQTFTAGWVLAKGLAALYLARTVYRPSVRFFGLSARYAWTLPLAGLLYGAMTLDSALRHLRGREVGWRG